VYVYIKSLKEKRKERTRKKFEEMPEECPNLMKMVNSHFQES
jgi:hypothetical protein